MNAKQLLHQKKLNKWTAMFHEQRESGLSVKDWCTQNNVSPYAFFYWKRVAKETYVQSLIPESFPSHPACAGTSHELRYGIDTLAAIIETRYNLPLFVPNTLFLFCGKRTNKIKGLVWEGDGFLLFTKRVSEGRFTWPKNSNEARQLLPQQFEWLMNGFPIEPQVRISHPVKSA